MRVSSIPVWLALLVGMAVLTAGSALLVSTLSNQVNQADLAVVDMTTPTPSASAEQGLTATAIGARINQPLIICVHCTAVPLPTVTPMAVVVTPPLLSTRVPPLLSPTSTRTAPPTRTMQPTTSVTQIPQLTAHPTLIPTSPATTSLPTVATTVPSATASVATSTPAPTALPTVTRVPPPIPPLPQVRAQLWMLSEFDPSQQVYRSATSAVTWPGGEVLHFAPAIALDVPASADPIYMVRSRVTAWSFVRSHGVLATALDSMGQSGCRLRTQPTPRDSTGLAGCAYRYLESPSATDLHMQAHAFWSVGKPLEMCADIYVYDLGQLQTIDLVLQARVLTELVDAVTGQVVSRRADIVPIPFTVTLAVPRSAR